MFVKWDGRSCARAIIAASKATALVENCMLRVTLIGRDLSLIYDFECSKCLCLEEDDI